MPHYYIVGPGTEQKTGKIFLEYPFAAILIAFDQCSKILQSVAGVSEAKDCQLPMSMNESDQNIKTCDCNWKIKKAKPMNFKSKAAEKYSVVRQTLVGVFSRPKHKKAKILDTVG